MTLKIVAWQSFALSEWLDLMPWWCWRISALWQLHIRDCRSRFSNGLCHGWDCQHQEEADVVHHNLLLRCPTISFLAFLSDGCHVCVSDWFLHILLLMFWCIEAGEHAWCGSRWLDSADSGTGRRLEECYYSSWRSSSSSGSGDRSAICWRWRASVTDASTVVSAIFLYYLDFSTQLGSKDSEG